MPSKPVKKYQKGDQVIVTISGSSQSFSGTIKEVMPNDEYSVDTQKEGVMRLGHWCLSTGPAEIRANAERRVAVAQKMLDKAKLIGMSRKKR